MHVWDHRQFNLFNNPNFRLSQYTLLSIRLAKIAIQEEVGAIIIAGDLIHGATARPHVVNTVFDCVSKLSEVCDVHLIAGQHDMDSRSSMSNLSTLLDIAKYIPKVHYHQRQSVKFGSMKFYFQGWTPDQNFDHIEAGEYDALVGHGTIKGSRMGQYNRLVDDEHGQDLPADKFKHCFMGDIHCAQDIGNIHIPGVPIQWNFGDDPENSVIIFDTETQEIKRVSTHGGEEKFLRFLITDRVYDDPYLLTKLPPTHVRAEASDKLKKSLDIEELISTEVLRRGLFDIHNRVKGLTLSSGLDDKINLNFKIVSLKVVNFRSIDLYERVFTDDQINLFVGINGSGKTSVITALKYMIEGNRTPKRFVRKKQTSMSVIGEIDYEGIRYKIERGFEGKGYINFWMNDVPVEAENQSALDDKIRKSLRFNQFNNLMFHLQGNPRFLNNLNYGSRVDLISKIIGLNITEKFEETALSINKKLTTDLEKLESDLLVKQKFIESIAELNLGDLDDVEKLSAELVELAAEKVELNKLKGYKNDFKLTTDSLQSLNTQLGTYDKEEMESSVDETEINASLQGLTEQKNSIDTMTTKIQKDKENIQSAITKSKLTIKSLRDKVIDENVKLSSLKSDSCFTCKQIINADIVLNLSKKSNELILTSVSAIKDLESSILSSEEALVTVDKTLNDLSKASNGFTEHINRFNLLKTQVSQVKKRQDSYKKLKDEILSTLNKLTETVAKINGRDSVDFEARLSEIQIIESEKLQSIARTKNLVELSKKVQLTKSEIEELSTNVLLVSDERNLFVRYIELMGPKGDIVRDVLTTLSTQLSNDEFEVVAFKTLGNGETRPDFTMSLKVDEEWINYDDCSGGQMILCDSYILHHLISLSGGCGLLVFDETFGECSDENLTKALSYLRSTDVKTVFIVSHHTSFPDYDTMNVATLTRGITEIKTI